MFATQQVVKGCHRVPTATISKCQARPAALHPGAHYLLAFLLAAALAPQLSAQYCDPSKNAQIRTGIGSLPSLAQAEISGAVGRDQPAYQAVAEAGGYRMTNGALSADLQPSGDVRWQARDQIWNTRLSGYGYGANLQRLKESAPTTDANRVEYRRAGLTEWYVSGPQGLEQGFTLTRRPGKANRNPLTLAFAQSGSLRAVVDAAGNSLTLTKNGAAVLRYGELTAVDSRGRELSVWLEASSTQLLLRVNDRQAHYPITIDPYVQLVTLTPCDGTLTDGFGFSTATSADGNTVVVTAPQAAGGGAAYVFVKPAKLGWNSSSAMQAAAKLMASTETLLTPTNTIGFGKSVGISEDGSTIVVSDWNGVSPGLYIFLRPSTGWAQYLVLKESAKLHTTGFTCDISGDGGTIAVSDDASGGSAFVFVMPSTGWASTSQANAELYESTPSGGDTFGSSVSVSGDGSTVAVGDFGWADTGAVYVYVRRANGWSDTYETGRLIGLDAQLGDNFGSSESISSDGSTIVAGAPGSSPNFPPGKAFIFTRPADGWGDITGVQVAELAASDGGRAFGSAVTTNSNGNYVAVTNYGVTGSIAAEGYSAYVFSEPPTGWAMTTGTAQFPASGIGVSGDGSIFLGVDSTYASGSVQLYSYVPGATDVTSSVTVTRGGFVLNLSTGRFAQTVTVTNNSSSIITGPISLVLDSLSANAALFDETGVTDSSAPPSGSPYLNSAGDLAPGQSATFALQFTDPTRTAITYNTRVLAGSGAR
jgi:trimeric autotransporter adhesin